MLREFWENPKHAKAKGVLLEWFKNVTAANWRNFADVKKTYNTSDQVGHKVVFDVGGNDYRGIAFIDYEAQRVYVRAVLDHKEYDKGNWKYDSFGDKWKPFKEMIQNRNGKSA
jgi:mRNA interferase HigB